MKKSLKEADPMRILFMGTPDFAKVSLEKLCDSGEDVIGAVTQPDSPVGRKQILTPSAVKVYAQSKNIPVYQPKTLRDEDFMKLLCSLSPELIVVVAYGKILPKTVLDFPKFGCINVHGSLLPEYRGAAPIQRAMLSGDDVTGVTTMYMDEGCDTGDMILQRSVCISDGENLEELYAKLAKVGAELLIDTVEQIKNGTAVRIKQDGAKATFAPKLTREDEHVDFHQSTKKVLRKINCMSPLPGAICNIDGADVKIYGARPCDVSKAAPSTVALVSKKSLCIATADGGVEITEIAKIGGKRMNITAFLCGCKPAVGAEVL